MSVWTTSLQSTSEVLSSILSKYKIESEVGHFYFTFKKLDAERKRIILNLPSKTLKIILGTEWRQTNNSKYNNLKQTILGDKFWVVCCERNR